MRTLKLGWHATLILCLAQVSCGHGPPERYASLGDYGSPPGADLTVALRNFTVSRPARGLSAFPDGGLAISLDGGVEARLCTKADHQFIQFAVIHESLDSLSQRGSTPMIIAWQDSAVLIRKYAGGDTIIRLPADIRIGSPPRKPLERSVIPQCKAALDSLRYSKVMPDGTAITDEY